MTWSAAMIAAGACSAATIILIRGLPSWAPGIPPMLTVGLYMLLGGAALLLLAFPVLSTVDGRDAIAWPTARGIAAMAAIGLLLAALEVCFVLGAKARMPLPDALVVYNAVSLGLVAVAGAIWYSEALTMPRLAGLALGIASIVLLLQPTTKG